MRRLFSSTVLSLRIRDQSIATWLIRPKAGLQRIGIWLLNLLPVAAI